MFTFTLWGVLQDKFIAIGCMSHQIHVVLVLSIAVCLFIVVEYMVDITMLLSDQHCLTSGNLHTNMTEILSA
jgi:hypothetical protein